MPVRQPIIEAASGSFAMALALAGRTAGHPVVLTMPEDAPALRQEYLLRLGAQILHSPAQRGLAGARALAETPAAEKGWYYMEKMQKSLKRNFEKRTREGSGDDISIAFVYQEGEEAE